MKQTNKLSLAVVGLSLVLSACSGLESPTAPSLEATPAVAAEASASTTSATSVPVRMMPKTVVRRNTSIPCPSSTNLTIDELGQTVTAEWCGDGTALSVYNSGPSGVYAQFPLSPATYVPAGGSIGSSSLQVDLYCDAGQTAQVTVGVAISTE